MQGNYAATFGCGITAQSLNLFIGQYCVRKRLWPRKGPIYKT